MINGQLVIVDLYVDYKLNRSGNKNNFFNKTKTDYMNNDLSRQNVLERYFNAIQKHDYSHMYSDDDRAWRSGKQSEDEIKQYIHTLVSVLREDATQLLEDSLYEVTEQYTDGLTHRIIRSWFVDYVENVNNVFVKPTFQSDTNE